MPRRLRRRRAPFPPGRPAVRFPAIRFGFIAEPYWPASQWTPEAGRRALGRRYVVSCSAVGKPALGLELREVGVHHHRRRRSKLGWNVLPGLGEQGGLRALAALEGREQATLPHLPVLDVLGQLRRRVLDPGPVAGADQLDRLGLHAGQRFHVGDQRATVGRDEGRALPEHQVAAEADPVRRRAGRRGRRRGRGSRSPAAPRAPRRRPGGRPRASAPRRRRRPPGAAVRAWPRPHGRHGWLRTTTPIPPRSSAAARTAARWPASSGPGSITAQGPDP